MYKCFGKRVIDIILSLCGLIVLILPMGIISVIVKIDSPGPAIFKQKRVGSHQKVFTVFKFRTMCDHAYEKGGIATSESDARITRVGKVLRRTSLDELPQLFNIIRGQMSIIGPRPILDWEFKENNNKPEYIQRFDVRPGLFCTVDVEHRNADRDLQFEMDAKYARECSLTLDIITFLKIIRTVVTGKGVYKDE